MVVKRVVNGQAPLSASARKRDWNPTRPDRSLPSQFHQAGAMPVDARACLSRPTHPAGESALTRPPQVRPTPAASAAALCPTPMAPVSGPMGAVQAGDDQFSRATIPSWQRLELTFGYKQITLNKASRAGDYMPG
jgi:hypothetical protein